MQRTFKAIKGRQSIRLDFYLEDFFILWREYELVGYLLKGEFERCDEVFPSFVEVGDHGRS
jgi:hypothetical protein